MQKRDQSKLFIKKTTILAFVIFLMGFTRILVLIFHKRNSSYIETTQPLKESSNEILKMGKFVLNQFIKKSR